jgi:nitroimidazol reductase NimA-like FMN-containing flavoprotein (pyridoxamine 5'-phosphate oxidase superfamily)
MTSEPSAPGGRDQRTGLLVLTPDECSEVLSSTSIGRIVFVDGEYPLALPVNFAWVEDSIVFRTGEGQKLRAATIEKPVSFEVDRIDETTHSGLSVIVKGTARAVTDWAEQEQLEQLPVRPWQRQPWRQGWVRIDPTEISGRKLDVQ